MSEYLHNPETPVIETFELSKRFGPKLALDHLTLTVPSGGVHALVGSNGAGKSTLFRVLLGIQTPSGGSSRILGVDSQALTPKVRGRISLVNEEHTLPAWMRVDDLSTLQRQLYPTWEEGIYRQVVGHFRVLGEQKVGQLSRGERAGLNLALALAQGPELLILDEPTLGLDVVAKQAFLESLLFAGEREVCTIVYCSHQMDEIERVANNLIILEEGRLAHMSSPEELCERVSYWVAQTLVAPPSERTIPGLIQVREIEGQHHLVLLDRSEGVAEHLESLGATGLRQVPVGLDRAVNAFLGHHHITPEQP